VQWLACCIGRRNECQEHYGNGAFARWGMGQVGFRPAVRVLRYRRRSGRWARPFGIGKRNGTGLAPPAPKSRNPHHGKSQVKPTKVQNDKIGLRSTRWAVKFAHGRASATLQISILCGFDRNSRTRERPLPYGASCGQSASRALFMGAARRRRVFDEKCEEAHRGKYVRHRRTES
jgi:hypothetical protein